MSKKKTMPEASDRNDIHTDKKPTNKVSIENTHTTQLHSSKKHSKRAHWVAELMLNSRSQSQNINTV